MSSINEVVDTNLSRIKLLKKVNNPNYNSEYYQLNKEMRKKYQDINKLKCTVCDLTLSMAARKTHILSAKHKLKLLETNTKLDNPDDCYVKIKMDTNIDK